MRRPTTLLLMLFCLLLTLPGCGQERALAIRTMNKGLETFQLGQTLDAVRLLKEATNQDPTYPDAAYNLAQIYHMKLSELDSALQYYKIAHERDAENPQINYRLGTVLMELNKHSDAVAHLQKATAIKPDFSKAWLRLGIAQAHEKAFVEAVEAFMKSIESDARLRMDEDDPGGAAYHELGDLYIKFGLYKEAVQVYENGILNNDKAPQLHQGLGVAQLKLKKSDAALSSLSKALEIDPSMVSAVFNLSVAYQSLGQTDKAVQQLEAFLARADPEKDEARIIAAEGLIQQFKEAKKREEEKKK